MTLASENASKLGPPRSTLAALSFRADAAVEVHAMRPILIIVLCLAIATIVVLMLSVHFALRLWL